MTENAENPKLTADQVKGMTEVQIGTGLNDGSIDKKIAADIFIARATRKATKRAAETPVEA